MVEENRELDISYLIFWFSLFWTGFVLFSQFLLLVREKLLHDFAKPQKTALFFYYFFFPIAK